MAAPQRKVLVACGTLSSRSSNRSGTLYALKIGMNIDFPFFDLSLLISHLASIAIAYLLTFPVAWDREQKAQSAGLRTFPLVAVASCSFVLIGKSIFADTPENQGRILEGLITGIGFIGGGAILKNKGSVQGTATAASIWNTGAVGVAVAHRHFEIAIILSLLNLITLRWLTSLKRKAKEQGLQERSQA